MPSALSSLVHPLRGDVLYQALQASALQMGRQALEGLTRKHHFGLLIRRVI